jgi:hypothetical protein
MDAAGGSRLKGNDIKKRRPAQARVYTLTSVEASDEDEENNDVVTSTISLFGSLACTFLDSRATHLFISASYVKLCHINTQSIRQYLVLETPGGEIVLCSKTVMTYHVHIEGRVLPTNLSVFKMLGYEIIIGMDWLSKYHASINCKKNEFVFHLPSVEEFRFCGSRVRATPPLLSVIQGTMGA